MRTDRLVLAVLMLAACRREKAAAEHEDDEKAAEPKAVTCAAARAQDVTDQIDVRGTVAPLPDRDAQVSAQVAGRILKVLVREGDRVRTGQPVAQIDTSPLQDDVAEAKAEVAKARAERENAESTLARVKRVFERGIAARQEYEDAAARAAAARATEEQASAAARRADLHIARATVRSPMNGVVLKVMHRSGEQTDGTPATPILEIGDPSKLELVGEAAGQDLLRIAPGAAAVISIVGTNFEGKVAAVSPALDKVTGLGTVRVALDLSKGTTPPVGIFGTARIQSGTPRKATVVPAVALRNAAGPEAEVVICGADKKARVAKVKTGVAMDDVVEVTGTVKAGDQVAVAPVLGIADGDALAPPEAEGESKPQAEVEAGREDQK